MKTLKFFKITMAFALTFSFFQSVAFYDLALADRWGGEAVKAVKSATVDSKGESKPSPEEVSNGASMSPYEACKGFMMVESGNYKSEFWQQRAKNCDAKVSNCALKVQTIPESGMFSSFGGKAGVTMSSTVTATAFLEGIRKDAVNMLSNGIKQRETVAAKCSSSGTSSECSNYVAATKAKISGNMANFRKVIARIAEPSKADLLRVVVSGDVSVLVNQRLAGVTRAMVDTPKMDALNADELAAAKKDFSDILARAKTEWAKEVDETVAKRNLSGREAEDAKRVLMREENFVTKLRKSIAEYQLEQVKSYDRIVNEVPEIASVGNVNAEPAAIVAAGNKVIAKMKTSQEAMSKPLDPKDLQTEAKIGEVLQYATFKRIIEQKLEAENRAGTASSCAVATAVYNRLKDVQARNQMIIAGVAMGGVLVGGAAGTGLLGAGMVGTGTAIAYGAGIAGLVGDIGIESVRKYELTRDANAGLAERQQSRDQMGVVALGAVLAPLDFMGTGAAVGSAALLAKAATRAGRASNAAVAAAAKVAAKAAEESSGTLTSFAANAVASGEVKVSGTSAEDVTKLAANATAAAKKSDEAAATTAMKGIQEAGDKGAKEILKRNPSSADYSAFGTMAEMKVLGDAKNPNFGVANAYASITQEMPEASRVKFAENLKKVAEVMAEGRKADAAAKSEAVTPVTGELALAIAESAPDVKAAAAVLTKNSGYNDEAKGGVLAVWKAAKALTKGAAVKTKEAVSANVKKALAKLTGKNAEDSHVKKLCKCMGACPLEAASNDSFEFESLAAPKYMACVNH